MKKIISSLFLFTCCLFLKLEAAAKIGQNFDGWAISKDCYKFIRENVPVGKTIIELGSGYSTRRLADFYNVFSIEHDIEFYEENKDFLNGGKNPVHFILAPIVKLKSGRKWYDPKIVVNKLPKNAWLIIIDGPQGFIGRGGVLENLDLFPTPKIYIFDDVHREQEKVFLERAAKILKKDYSILGSPGGKQFGVIYTAKKPR